MRLIKYIKKDRRVDLLNIFNTFFKNSSIGGIVLIFCAIAALLIANVPQLSHLHNLLNQTAGFSIGDNKFEMSLLHWINDGLMAVFFLVVGLEIKREVLVGELSSLKQASLPIFAAIGGMAIPALIYVFFSIGTVYQNGWGIPIALGILSLLGKRVPTSLKIFLAALAIVDDLGAIIVLAIFYPTHTIDLQMLLYAGMVFSLMIVFNRLNIIRPSFYIIPGIILWFLILGSGIHATIAGVLLALTIPGKNPINEVRFLVGCRYLLNRFSAAGNHSTMVLENQEQQQIIHNLHYKIKQAHPLMLRFEHALHPWVTFIIMPLFALANAGVILNSKIFSPPFEPIVPGIFFGLLLGKPLGIFLASWLAVKLKIADLNSEIKWSQIFSVGIIAGIGFTMSIFIDNLAFTDFAVIDMGKATILGTSFLAALIGLLAIYITTKDKTTKNN